MLKKFTIYSMSVILVVLIFVGVLSFNVFAEENDKYGGKIRVPIESVSLPRMDPHYIDSIGRKNIGLFIAEPLLRFVEGEYIPVLAEDWEVSADAKTFKIFIRKDVLFHNGKTLTAADVKENFERISNENLVDAGHLTKVESLNVLDDYTLEVNLSDSNPFFLSKLQEIVIVDPDSWVGIGQDDGVVGTGPFQYDVDSYRAEASQTLTRFDDYWGGLPYLEEVEIVVTGGKDASRIQLEKGEVHVALFAELSSANALKDDGMQIIPFGRINWASVALNQKKLDLPIRQAINYAFNPEAILNSPAVFSGYGILQKTIAYPDTDYYRPELGYSYDPDRAREILDEAGWVDSGNGIREKNGEKLVLNFPSREGEGWTQASQMIQSMLRQVGIDSKIMVQPISTFYSNIRDEEYDWDLAWWLLNAPPEPSISTINFDARHHWSTITVTIDELQAKLEEAESTVDADERAELIRELQQIHHDYAVSALGVWMKQIHVARPELNGVKVNSIGHFYNFHNWWLQK